MEVVGLGIVVFGFCVDVCVWLVSICFVFCMVNSMWFCIEYVEGCLLRLVVVFNFLFLIIVMEVVGFEFLCCFEESL